MILKKNEGISRITLTIIVGILIILLCGVAGIIVGIKAKSENQNLNTERENNIKLENENTTLKNETTQKLTTETKEFIFTKDFLEKGNKNGNVDIIENQLNNSIIVSITGISNNNIDQTNFVSTKNRWYTDIDLSQYNTLELYARKGKDNGDLMVCIDNTMVKRVRYTNLPSVWTKYEIDVSKYNGIHTISLAGGYADNTGSVESNTQYTNIKLK